MDREKVIKGLKNCSIQNDFGCQGCPYLESRKQYGHEWCTTELAQDALTLLKEQEAVKPYIDIDEAKCPICKVKLTRQELLGDDVLFEDFFDYCPHCGRSVKWE